MTSGIVSEQPTDEILSNFRRYIESHIDAFIASRDRVFHLLGSRQQHASGTYREHLLKDFFRSWLPTAVSIDSGFIYAFDVIPASAQLDIIIWHSEKHAPVYRGRDFVIVPPEAVIAAVSVKSGLNNRDIREGIDNLGSITPIELRFRQFKPLHGHHTAFPPITKILVAYRVDRKPKAVLDCASKHYKSIFSTDHKLASSLVEVFSGIDPFQPSESDMFTISRIFPAMIAGIDVNSPSFFFGYGPPDAPLAVKRFSSGLRRIPYLYKQSNQKTTSFQKCCFEVLQAVYRVIGTLDWPTTSAWLNVDPVSGASPGDAWEIEVNTGVPLVSAELLPS